jgi:hypothetical protein
MERIRARMPDPTDPNAPRADPTAGPRMSDYSIHADETLERVGIRLVMALAGAL